jgi:hypothetical protein
LEKPDETASRNNRSLAPRETFGLPKSEWELSFRDCSHSCFYCPAFLASAHIFSAANFTTFAASKNPEREKRTG